MLNGKEIIELIRALNLPVGGYWISAGAGLVLHGVKELTRDVDVGCTTDVYERLLQMGGAPSHASDGSRKLELGESMEFFEDWLADEIETIDGISVASLTSIKKFKLKLGREKDMRDIALIDSFLESRKNDSKGIR